MRCRLALLICTIAAAGIAPAVELPTLDALTIPHQQFKLENGLTVVVHEDHNVPLVAVNLWYHVGSQNERRGRTGFAHLFEHFFFNGSEHYPHGFREAMDDLGANNRNGTTNTDRTNFFEDVPVSALERTLYLEADRMGWLAGNLSEAMLERERGVVQNEKRQGLNRPYGQVWERIVETVYPHAHPYSWSTIGRMEDLDAAKLDDVRDWYRSYYGPNNAVLVLAGDIDLARARELVEKYFGPIPPGAPVTRLGRWIPSLDRNVSDTMEDRVPQARIYRHWHAPDWGHADLALLELFADGLSGSDSAPLTRRLVFEKQLATDVSGGLVRRELASSLLFQISVKPGVDPAAVEAELDAVLAEQLDKGFDRATLERSQARAFAAFTRGLERLGGFFGRAPILAESATFGGRADAYRERLRQLREATPAVVRAAAQRWLQQPHYTLRVNPFASLAASKDTIDRSQLPKLDAPADVAFPQVQRARLDNGLELILLERHSAPLLQVALTVDAGIAADPGTAPGCGRLVLDLLDLGTHSRTAFAIADQRDLLGASFHAFNSLDQSVFGMQALRVNADASLALFADVARNPAFAADMVEIQRKKQLAAIAQEQAEPFALALRLAPRLLYGSGHPYAVPASGLGQADAVAALTAAELRRWHATWFRPNAATLIVAGDITLAELRPLVERHFGDWTHGEVPAKQIAAPTGTAAGKLYLVDRPNAPQSVIVAAHLTEPGGAADDLAIDTVMRNFGGIATSRLNRNLRLDKHWSYGATATLEPARGPRSFLVIAPVQSDRTADAMREVRQEIIDIAGARPIVDSEFESIQRNQIAALAGRIEGLDALVGAALQMTKLQRPATYYYDYVRNLRTMRPEDLARAAERLVRPEQLAWIIIGDLGRIEAEVKALGYGEPVRLDNAARP